MTGRSSWLKDKDGTVIVPKTLATQSFFDDETTVAERIGELENDIENYRDIIVNIESTEKNINSLGEYMIEVGAWDEEHKTAANYFRLKKEYAIKAPFEIYNNTGDNMYIYPADNVGEYDVISDNSGRTFSNERTYLFHCGGGEIDYAEVFADRSMKQFVASLVRVLRKSMQDSGEINRINDGLSELGGSFVYDGTFIQGSTDNPGSDNNVHTPVISVVSGSIIDIAFPVGNWNVVWGFDKSGNRLSNPMFADGSTSVSLNIPNDVVGISVQYSLVGVTPQTAQPITITRKEILEDINGSITNINSNLSDYLGVELAKENIVITPNSYATIGNLSYSKGSTFDCFIETDSSTSETAFLFTNEVDTPISDAFNVRDFANGKFVTFNVTQNASVIKIFANGSATFSKLTIFNRNGIQGEITNVNESLNEQGLLNKFDGELVQEHATAGYSDYYVSSKNYIECVGGKNVTLKVDGAYTDIGFAFYDVNYSRISMSTTDNSGKLYEYTAIAPNNAKYIKVNIGWSYNAHTVSPQTVGKVTVYINNEIDNLKNDLSVKGIVAINTDSSNASQGGVNWFLHDGEVQFGRTLDSIPIVQVTLLNTSGFACFPLVYNVTQTGFNYRIWSAVKITGGSLQWSAR